MSGGRNGLIAALDIGTTKVCCFIARVDGGRGDMAPRLRVVGIGHQIARGVRAGTVVDMEAVERSIRAAVDAAERMAGETIRKVVVNLSGAQPASHTVGVEMTLGGHDVREADLRRVLQQARARAEPGAREVIHAIPVGYTIDGSRGIRDPRGMYAERLGVNMHIVTAAAGPIRNLITCIERCHLDVAGIVVSPFASGLATLVDDETDLGVTLIDMGGGTTSVAVFLDGNVIHVDIVPLGGIHVTSDIARGLSTSLSHAERMKTLYGSAIPSPSDEREMINVPQVGEDAADAANHVPRSMLTGIIRPRMEEIIEFVRDRLEAADLLRAAGRRVVLCGGASQLTGARELAGEILNKQVRAGHPIRIQGLAEATGGPAFSTCAGLLAYALRGPIEAMDTESDEPHRSSTGRFQRIGNWIRENF